MASISLKSFSLNRVFLTTFRSKYILSQPKYLACVFFLVINANNYRRNFRIGGYEKCLPISVMSFPLTQRRLCRGKGTQVSWQIIEFNLFINNLVITLNIIVKQFEIRWFTFSSVREFLKYYHHAGQLLLVYHIYPNVNHDFHLKPWLFRYFNLLFVYFVSSILYFYGVCYLARTFVYKWHIFWILTTIGVFLGKASTIFLLNWLKWNLHGKTMIAIFITIQHVRR